MDVRLACRAAREWAQLLGFDPQCVQELVLVCSELGGNLVRHAIAGELILTPQQSGRAIGLQIESKDRGPGIADVKQALADGFSTKRSLGLGLGAVNRLMDEMEIRSRLGRGTHIVCRKWVPPPPAAGGPLCPLDVGIASRPRALGAADANGDDFIFKRGSDQVLLGVIDGLGHGPAAHLAARTARRYVETHFQRPLQDIFTGTDRACRGTRGVVMALASVAWAAGQFEFASIGNIEARLVRNGRASLLVARRGILGVNAPRALVASHEWNPNDLLVLHSDGVRSGWVPEFLAAGASRSAGAHALAARILQGHAKPRDDATVLIVNRRTL